jgi:hypothetical protein
MNVEPYPPPFEFPRQVGRDEVPALIDRYRESIATVRNVPGPQADPVGWVQRLCFEPILAGPHPAMSLAQAAERIVSDVIMLNGLWFGFHTIADGADRAGLRLHPRYWIWSLTFRRGEFVLRRAYATDLWPVGWQQKTRAILRLSRACPYGWFIVPSHVVSPHFCCAWPEGLPPHVLPVPNTLIEP